MTVPHDFLIYSAKAMQQLKNRMRSNVLYKLARGIGTVHKDGSDSCFPTKRMPMSMLEYMADFYSSPNLQTVRLVLVQSC